jgi:predicted metalloendopeptidase
MAANFGAMGVVMGHEITHGFDDSGRQFTAEGTMEDWWEAASAEGFESKAECVIDAYGSFEALPGVNVDGELTLGENIADIGGARFAFRAYQGWAAEQEQPEPDVAGLSPEQLYFVSFAQAWCAQQTDESLEEQVKTDPHSPAKFRINGTLRHTPAFHETFGCEPGSGMRPQSDDELCVVW